MELACLPYDQINFLPALMQDYLNDRPELRPLYGNRPDPESFAAQIESKSFSESHRQVLADVLTEQYQGISGTTLQHAHIEALRQPNTYTVTTGHQLCLFTGPMYFFYKILSTINLAERLQKDHPNKHFVPVFWMASEDHDFEEINHFYVNGERLTWDSPFGGAVGEMATQSIQLEQELRQVLGGSLQADELIQLFQDAYHGHKDLAAATRHLVHQVLGTHGVVILDPNDARLKRLFADSIKREIQEGIGERCLQQSIRQLTELGYKHQVNPRDINLFYLANGKRLRLTHQGKSIQTADGSFSWKAAEIAEELDAHPERFSPNVAMRPLYQEVILPNLAYIGGAGEMSYWFELKGMFEAHQVEFPILMLRNSVLIMSARMNKKMDQLGLQHADLFTPIDQLKNTWTLERLPEADMVDIAQELERLGGLLSQKATALDASLQGAAAASNKRWNNEIKRIQNKMVRAEKRRRNVGMRRIEEVKEMAFPNGTFQERKQNFAAYYLQGRWAFLSILKENLDPFNQELYLLKEKVE